MLGLFKLLAHAEGGETLTLAEDLDGEDVAAHFRGFLANRLGID